MDNAAYVTWPSARSNNRKKGLMSTRQSPNKMEKQEFAYYPLTPFDGMVDHCGIAAGWLVEGLLDLTTIEQGLNRIIAKWPMLSGRLEFISKLMYRVNVPLDTLPPDYLPFALTHRESSTPITAYVQLPLPAVSDALPQELFIDPSVPKATRTWVEKKLPLTYWHITHFKQPGMHYTCIGVSFSHALLDGTGIANLVHALEAEMLGKPWAVPPALHSGQNENHLQVFLNRTRNEIVKEGKEAPENYTGVSVVGIWFVVTFFFWHVWQQVWHNMQKKMIVLPVRAYEKLVLDAREALLLEGKKESRISTGDVLAAWLFKTVYATEPRQDMRVHLSNMASLRMFSGGELSLYPHNCFIPIPYPVFTVADLQATPVHNIAYTLAGVRASLSLGHAMQVHAKIEELVNHSFGFKGYRTLLPFDSSAEESLVMSNMSIARMVDINWSGAGGGRTLGRYKSLLMAPPILIGNAVTIAGRLHDGSTLIDAVLSGRRMKEVEQEVERLIKRAFESAV
ncbi:unnamed protein product [Cyclocybe aegerita]|uniref:Uncharacterized protein n=1 Tax=Cyclocybe aegerita TaxID=1973307 RepID=A0A8S0W0D6_CYCAE|nr:unnamed protein product [Cyclocybe aegerita]